MIDMHAHILPGMDDGAADMRETLEMAEIAVESGVNAIVATPHYNLHGVVDQYTAREYVDNIRHVREILRTERIPLKVIAGMEVFVTPNICKLIEERKIYTINRSRYLLVEFDFGEDPGYVQTMLDQIRRYHICPVIAHPERYEFVQDNPQLVYQWRKQGYLTQVNKGSLLKKFGNRSYITAYQLLNHNLVSVIGSDAHGCQERTPWMMDVHDELAKNYSAKYLDLLFEENPRRICQNQPTIRFQLKSFEYEEQE